MSNQLACPHCQGVVAIDVALAGRTVQCPHCGQQFKMPPAAQPVEPATQPEMPRSQVAQRYRGRRQRTDRWVPSPSHVAFLLVAVSIGTLVIIIGRDLYEAHQADLKRRPQVEAEIAEQKKERTAIRIAREYVRDGLKHPHDASFPWFETDARHLANGDWDIRATVEAKNDLGLSLTHEWRCIVRPPHKNEPKWDCRYLRIGEDVLLDERAK